METNLIGKPKLEFDNKGYEFEDLGNIDRRIQKCYCTCTVTNLKGEKYKIPITEQMVRIFKAGDLGPLSYMRYPMYERDAVYEYLTKVKV